jgi:D-xylose transport system ATP-binding protein
MSEAILEARGITKQFPGVVALKDVTFDLQPGEIHALCGENGAGKSTLIKLLSGIHPYGSYDGELIVKAQRARFRGIADAERSGIAVIYQELALVDELTVAENIFLGAEAKRFGFVDWSRVRREARELLARFDVQLDPDMPCRQLGVGERQLVEIVKALRKNSRVLILDEPTAALAEHEVQVLLSIVRDLRSRGIACIYISHKLEEVFSIADRVTVLRDGATVFTASAAQTNSSEIIRHMVGREIEDFFPRRSSRRLEGSVALRVSNLSVAHPVTNRPRLHEISFNVAPGEVLGIGGLMGAGRSELLMHIFGAWGRRTGGTVELNGRPMPILSPTRVLRQGLAIVSEDRRRYGLVLEQSVGFNLSLSSIRNLTHLGLVDSGKEFDQNDALYRSMRVKAPGLETVVGKLSGGNQQKVVLGKALMTGPSVVLLDEPTRGIDVGAKLEIYELINQLTDAGRGVVLVSSELPELIGMSDRILMLHEGRTTGEFNARDVTQETLMQAALGEN